MGLFWPNYYEMSLFWNVKNGLILISSKITIFAIRQNKPIFDQIALKWAYFDNLKMSLNWFDEKIPFLEGLFWKLEISPFLNIFKWLILVIFGRFIMKWAYFELFENELILIPKEFPFLFEFQNKPDSKWAFFIINRPKITIFLGLAHIWSSL